MFKVINIDGKSMPMKSNGATLRIYRETFKRDFLGDLFKMAKAQEGAGDMDMQFLEDIAWTMAKTANPKIPDVKVWMQKMNDPLAIYNASEELINMLTDSVSGTKQSKKKKT